MQTRTIGGALSTALFASAIAAIPAPNARAQTFGGFAPPQTFPVGDTPFSIAIGDLNGDGALDLAVVNQGLPPDFVGSVSILLGDGGGSFAPQQTFSVGMGPNAVAMGDLNGDGALDLAVVNEGSDNISVLLGDGFGAFAPQQTFPSGPNPFSIAMGDLNGDGALDLAVASTVSTSPFIVDGGFSVLFGDGSGAFGPPQTFIIIQGVIARPLVMGDLNGDGALDLVIGSVNSSKITVILGDGAGSFFFGQDITGNAIPNSFAIGDLNGDGVLDLALTSKGSTNNPDGGVTIYLGNGDGTFAPPHTFAAGRLPLAIAIGDLNGDGANDIAVTNIPSGFLTLPRAVGDAGRLAVTSGGLFSVLLGDGAGGFTRFPLPQLLPTGSIPFSIVMGDLNGDGALDLAVANTGSNTVSILLNCASSPDLNGNGIVNGADLTTLLAQWGSAGSADLNCDGSVDAVDLANLLANWGPAP